MLSKIYPYRFEMFLMSQLAILFGSLVVPPQLFESFFAPILFQLNIFSGIILLSKKRKLMWFLVILLVIVGVVYGITKTSIDSQKSISIIQMGAYFLFYLIITRELIYQVWKAENVNRKVILGLISGYISLGLIGFFICLSIEISYPDSFTNLEVIGQTQDIAERLMYFSYITLLTIGYGDIHPVTVLAQKASILIGLMGQFYLVILTALIVGKYLNQKMSR